MFLSLSLEKVIRYIVFCAVTISFVSIECNPLQLLPWSPLSPFHEYIAEDESRDCPGETQGPCRFHQVSPRLHQLYFTLDTCNDRESWSGNCHMYQLFLSLMSTHTLSITFLPKSSFKIVTRKIQLSPKSRWNGLYSVMITEWDQLGI
jgi:hypothetical protein